jgi:inosine/xanthosine triphosphate pyrophosphatase family protein
MASGATTANGKVSEIKKNSKKAKLKAKELKKVEPYELQEINKKATNSWKLRREI